VVNIFYGCLERSDAETVIAVLSKVAYHIVPVLTRNMKIYSRHKSIVSLSAKIFNVLVANETCRMELEKAGTLQLIA
jgi:hypothetical protein